MSGPSKIEWTDATWNPIGGCSIKSPGCAPCYAQKLAGTRLKNHPLYAGTTDIVKGKPVFNGRLTVAPDDHSVWRWPIGWRGAVNPRLGPGMPSLIFVGDMSDLFHEKRTFAAIDRAVAPIIYSRHIGQLLTKRPECMTLYFHELALSWRWMRFNHPLFGKSNFAPEATFENAVIPRLWLGMSAERQREFDERWPHLRTLATIGFTVFLSYEPAIGPLVLPDDFLALGKRAQVIAGGMSGEDYAPAHPAWFRAIRDQCAAAGVAFFFKQWGEYAPALAGYPIELSGRVASSSREFADVCADKSIAWMERVGKKIAGRTLDGITHDGFPEVRAA